MRQTNVEENELNEKKLIEKSERVGFEPTVRVNAHTLSKRAP